MVDPLTAALALAALAAIAWVKAPSILVVATGGAIGLLAGAAEIGS